MTTSNDGIYRGQIYSRRNYFDDGRRKIDFVLVSSLMKTSEELDLLTHFLVELMNFGIETEISPGQGSADLIFIKLHCPREVLEEYAEYQHFVFDYRNPHILRRWYPFFACRMFHNVTTQLRPKHPVFNRAYGSLSSNKPLQITSWERSHLMHKILLRTNFSTTEEGGLNKLIAMGVLKDAYPIHDGPYEWRRHGPLTDRQLLFKYWASMLAIFKHQPLPLIYKYFGPEVAFYFAFTDFYTKMLFIPACVGLILVVGNAVARDYIDTVRVSEICENETKLCTLCFHIQSCRFTELSRYCSGAYILPVFDNIAGGIFAIFMGFWSIIFNELWKRQEYKLKFRWNLLTVEADSTYRLEFFRNAKYQHISSITGEKEYYTPMREKILNHCRSLGGLLLMFLIVILLIFLNTLYRVEVTTFLNNTDFGIIVFEKAFFIMSTSAILSTIIITYLAPYFRRFSVYLTNKENPSTYVDFLNACIYKVYATSFANGYFPFFYVAFVKGAFFTHPGDHSVYDALSLRTDICNVNGCAYALTISLIFFFALKNSVQRIVFTALPIIKEKLMRDSKRKRRVLRPRNLATWERDYKLKASGDLYMMGYFMNVAMQIGYVLFFISALQLTPVMAFLTSLVNIRLDAIHILRNHRRPVARLLPGIGAWNNILQIIAYIGVASNALVIAFTSDLWQREIYRYFHGGLAGYVNSTLSEFATKDYIQDVKPLMEDGPVDVCVYRASRHPYYHEEKYKHSEKFWFILTYKLGFVIIYEQLLWFIMAMVSTFRDSVPAAIKDHLRNEKFRQKSARYHFLLEMPVPLVPEDELILDNDDSDTMGTGDGWTIQTQIPEDEIDDNYFIP